MIDDTTKPALAILQPDWDSIRPANVDALMTLRAGGVSSGPFGDKDGIGGFNVGIYTGDVPVCVNMNRNLAAQLVPTDPKWLKQVHGDRVVDAETAAPEEEADASTSITPNVVCVVQVADCLPVLIAEKNGKGVAAVHCGWRSLAAGILQKTIERLRERIGDPDAQFIAWLGPRIGDDDFETGSDVLEAMQTSIDGAEVAFKANEDGKYLCSLTTLARMALLQVNVEEVVEARHSTYANPELFYSLRRDGKTGRHAAMIWIKG
ncbi:peptidoglycan editing factor PgeF [Parasutterella secunda]|uniref:peptidoglycan editing factor PgeF n=1 Tax=Parasutterella secunda TaxID=626947 RepID=UPI0025A3A018|nr:peptidoglycan editing factor PgeF [Parasutterella secunda]MDM8225602.1 peptidoglycan editing factor PgeF [Parasutterella secunda]